jgi:hypothetical protein
VGATNYPAATYHAILPYNYYKAYDSTTNHWYDLSAYNQYYCHYYSHYYSRTHHHWYHKGTDHYHLADANLVQ